MNRLPIIGQDCQSCPLQTKCWDTSKNPSDEALALNLLVCRMKLGIKRDRSTKLLLQLLEPKVQSIVKFICSKCNVPDRRTLHGEVQSQIVEYLLTEYKLGERAWPLHFLFARPKGVMTGWALRYIERANSDQRVLAAGFEPGVEIESLVDDINASITSGRISQSPDVPSTTDEPDDLRSDIPLNSANRTVEDGVTLTTREYRVLRFMLTHAEDHGLFTATAPGYGMRSRLAQHLDWPKRTVSRIYQQACHKIIEAHGHTDKVLGLAQSPVDPGERRARVLKLDERRPLTDDEALGLIRLADEIGNAAACQAYGVLDKTLIALRKRYLAMGLN